VLVATGRHRSRAWACGRRVGRRPLLARPGVAGPDALARLARLARLAGPSRRPLAGAVGARPGWHLVVIRAVTAQSLGARAAWGRRDAVAGNPPPVRHYGLLRRRADATGRLRPRAIVGRTPAVWLRPPGPRPWAAARRKRRRVLRPGPRAVRRSRVARSLARRSRWESRPRRHTAVRAATGRAGRHVGRPGPVAGAASVAGIDRVGAGRQGGVKLGILRVAVAVGGFGGPAARTTARPAALTIHPLPPDPERVRRAVSSSPPPADVAAVALRSSVGRAARRGMADGQLARFDTFLLRRVMALAAGVLSAFDALP